MERLDRRGTRRYLLDRAAGAWSGDLPWRASAAPDPWRAGPRDARSAAAQPRARRTTQRRAVPRFDPAGARLQRAQRPAVRRREPLVVAGPLRRPRGLDGRRRGRHLLSGAADMTRRLPKHHAFAMLA